MKENYTMQLNRVARALSMRTVLKGGPGNPLKLGVLLAIAFMVGPLSQSAISQQTDGTGAGDTTSTAVQPQSSPDTARTDGTFIIGADDVLAINVWKEPDITRSIPVRSDGKISLPLIGDIQAAGRTPMQLEQDLADRLKSYITDPQVTVIVQQINSQKYNILGQVAKPGSFPLAAGTTIVDAIAISGGFKDFAKRKGVYLLRQGPRGNEERYNFNYDKFIKGKNTAQNIKLRPHDTIVVP
jgi:polysaccharide export outer membrane protein